MQRGREVVIESLDASVPIELYGSGERIGPLPARLEAVPGALRVMVPR
jgi:diacylglycerol kinase family enzyme